MLWQGALTSGKGSTGIYGRFWFEGKSWYAHLWAAKYIHGLDIGEGEHCDHCCEVDGKRRPNTLCVQHLQPLPAWVNLRLRWSRFWEYWADEYGGGPSEEEPPITDDPPASPGVPFYEKPEWLKEPVTTNGNDDDCPF